eukprot:Skav223774  [mRNA]  locus=scaffold521:197680:199383:+ [translate_table: standard]
MAWHLLLLSSLATVAADPEKDPKKFEVDDVTWTTALLLISFVVISLGILCLVNCRDDDIRKESWQLLNMTMSVFSAASFDFSILRIIETFTKVESFEDLTKERSIWFFSLTGLFLASVCVVLYSLILNITSHHRLFAVSTLGSHVYAFAEIIFFGHLQIKLVVLLVATLGTSCVFMVPLIALAFMVLLFGLATGLTPVDGPEKKLQMHQLKHLQIEGSAIVVSFLMVQSLCFVMSEESEYEKRFMPILFGLPGKHKRWCASILFGLFLGLMMGSSMWSIWLVPHKWLKGCKNHFCHHLCEFIGEFLSVAGCWCFLRGGVIMFYGMLLARMNWYLDDILKIHSIQVDELLVVRRAHIVNGFLASLVAVVGIWFIDKVADKVQGKDRQGQQGGAGEFSISEDPDDQEVIAGTPRFHEDVTSLDLENIASSLRLAMSGFGLLVGIAWDKAFETSYEALLNKKSLLNYHIVGNETSLLNYHIVGNETSPHNDDTVSAFVDDPIVVTPISFLLAVYVAVAWYWYIVPHAMKETETHEREIQSEQDFYSSLKLPKARTPRESPETSSASESET